MTEILIPKKNVVLDATMLSSLMSCGRLTDFRFNHLQISSGGKSNSLEVGSIVHEGLETYYKNKIGGMNHNMAVGHALASAELYVRGCPHCTNFSGPEGTKPECGHAVDKYPGVQNTPMDNSSSPSRIGWRWALDTLTQYFDYYKADIWVPLEVEKVLSKVLYEDDEIRVLWKAKLDLLVDTSHGIFSCDHKTMKQRRDLISLNNQFIGQSLVTEKRAIWINKIGFQTTLAPADKFTRTYVPYTADRLLEWQSEILPFWAYQLVNYTESGYWPPNFTHCDNKYGACIYQKVCEANREMRAEEFKLNFITGSEWNPSNED